MISIAPESFKRIKTPIKKIKYRKEDRHKNPICDVRKYDSHCVAMPATLGLCLSASATLEAALVMPLFIYATIAVMYLMQIIGIQVHIQEALYNESRMLAKYAYACDCVNDELNNLDMKELDEDYMNCISRGLDKALVYTLFLKEVGTDYANKAHIVGGNAGYIFRDPRLEPNTQDLEISVTYTVNNPFDIFGIGKSVYTQKAFARAWTGLTQIDDCDTKKLKHNEYVYVAKLGEVYHLTSQCTYLTPSVTLISKDELAHATNLNGGRYYACEYCKGNNSGKFYVTSYGERYHTKEDCSRIKREYQVLSIDKVEGMKVCEKCKNRGE